MSDSFRQQETLFTHASALPVNERADFLARACGGDETLRRSISELLEASRDAAGFLESSPGAIARPCDDGAGGAVEPGTRVGRYRLLEKLGEGGAGIVFEAEQEEPVRRRVALKLMRAGTPSAAAAKRFADECQALALMEHPNIARVFDAGSTGDGRLYFVMELVRGLRVTAFCDEHRLTLEERVELLVQTCLAVQHAHAKGFVHRDLKPSNVLVTRYDAAPTPKIIDFGIAKPATVTPTDHPGESDVFEYAIGTPAYMSPEQARAGAADIDGRADIYSLGVLLYELLAGCTPFETAALDGASLEGLQRHICLDRPPCPSQRVSALPTELRRAIAKRRRLTVHTMATRLRGPLDAIVMRCLEKNPTQRYASAGALADALQRYLHCRAAPHLARPAAAPAPEARSLAVLPFATFGRDPACVAFAEGLHEDVISTLARIRDLRVISRTSVLSLPRGRRNTGKIAAALHVAHILEGSVRCAGTRVRVTAQLIDARVDGHLWARTYDRESSDVFALQIDIARAIAHALRATLTGRERAPTRSRAAYAAFQRGRRLAAGSFGREDVLGSVAAFTEATTLDPQFALAWAHLSMAHGSMYWFTFLDPSEARLARCRAAADEALRLEPDLPEAHLALGVYYYRGLRAWANARSELEIARAIVPHDAGVHCHLGLVLRRMGGWDESTAGFERAVNLDPRHATAWLSLIDNHMFHHRYDDALVACARVLAFAPEERTALRARAWSRFALDGDRYALFTELAACCRGAPHDTRQRAELALWRGEFDEALGILAAGSEASFRDNRRELATAELQALAAHLGGDPTAARRFAAAAVDFYGTSLLHREPEEAFTLVSLGRCLALLGRSEEALDCGRRAQARLPVTRDALWGTELITEHAALCLLAGADDEALTHLAALARQPCDLSAHELHLDPLWRRLAGHARFEAIAASFGPQSTEACGGTNESNAARTEAKRP